jgi:hypothetical protein
MSAYATEGFTPVGAPPRDLPQFGWLRAHYRQVAQLPGFPSLAAHDQWQLLTEHVLASPAGGQWPVLKEVPEPRRAQVLAWLRSTSDLPVAATLTLRAIAHIGSGPDLRRDRRPFQFEVLGLPGDQQAWIADFRGGWRILRVVDGQQGNWSPDPYLAKEDALQALAEVVVAGAGRDEWLTKICAECNEPFTSRRPPGEGVLTNYGADHVIRLRFHDPCYQKRQARQD